MKCEVCGKNGLRWWKKLLMAFSFPLKCQVCDTRYRLNVFSNVIGQLMIGLLYIPVILANIWLYNYISWQWIVVLDLIIWVASTLIIPVEINPRDPVNAVIQRIQDKKLKMKSTESQTIP